MGKSYTRHHGAQRVLGGRVAGAALGNREGSLEKVSIHRFLVGGIFVALRQQLGARD